MEKTNQKSLQEAQFKCIVEKKKLITWARDYYKSTTVTKSRGTIGSVYHFAVPVFEKFLSFFEIFGNFEGSSFIGPNPYRKELGGANGVTGRVSTWLWTWETSGTFWNVREPGRTRRRNVLVADAIKAWACPYTASSLQDKLTLKKRLPSQEASYLPTVFHSYSNIYPRYCNLNLVSSSLKVFCNSPVTGVLSRCRPVNSNSRIAKYPEVVDFALQLS